MQTLQPAQHGTAKSPARRDTQSPAAAYPALDCPLCGAVRSPRRVNKDQSVTYVCPPDHEHHGSQYTWRIAVDGTLIE